MYNEHIQHVRECIPAEDLLILNVKEGWQPLCDFLDVSVPKHMPFLHVNKSNTVVRLLNTARLAPYFIIFLVVVILIAYFIVLI